MSFLSNILKTTRESVAMRERDLSLEQLQAETEPLSGDRRFLHALRQDDIAVIAEFKRSAPSSSLQHLNACVEGYVQDYVRNGASALSILTEESQFRGSLRDLEAAREVVAREGVVLPVLRKDFVIGGYQIYEAVKAGADAILLIAAVLDEDLSDLHRLARKLGLDALVEVRDKDELRRAIQIDADLIGINNRNLDTFKVDVDTTHMLAKEIPSGVTIVSESGLQTRSQLDELAEIGVHAALIGSVLMNASDTPATCRELTGSHRSTNASRPSDQPAFA